MNLSEIRAEIDSVDEAMLQLFLKRMRLSELVAEYKKAHDLPIYNAEREEEILSWVSRESGEFDKYACEFFMNLFKLSRLRQEDLLAVWDQTGNT